MSGNLSPPLRMLFARGRAREGANFVPLSAPIPAFCFASSVPLSRTLGKVSYFKRWSK